MILTMPIEYVVHTGITVLGIGTLIVYHKLNRRTEPLSFDIPSKEYIPPQYALDYANLQDEVSKLKDNAKEVSQLKEQVAALQEIASQYNGFPTEWELALNTFKQQNADHAEQVLMYDAITTGKKHSDFPRGKKLPQLRPDQIPEIAKRVMDIWIPCNKPWHLKECTTAITREYSTTNEHVKKTAEIQCASISGPKVDRIGAGREASVEFIRIEIPPEWTSLLNVARENLEHFKNQIDTVIYRTKGNVRLPTLSHNQRRFIAKEFDDIKRKFCDHDAQWAGGWTTFNEYSDKLRFWNAVPCEAHTTNLKLLDATEKYSNPTRKPLAYLPEEIPLPWTDVLHELKEKSKNMESVKQRHACILRILKKERTEHWCGDLPKLNNPQISNVALALAEHFGEPAGGYYRVYADLLTKNWIGPYDGRVGPNFETLPRRNQLPQGWNHILGVIEKSVVSLADGRPSIYTESEINGIIIFLVYGSLNSLMRIPDVKLKPLNTEQIEIITKQLAKYGELGTVKDREDEIRCGLKRIRAKRNPVCEIHSDTELLQTECPTCEKDDCCPECCKFDQMLLIRSLELDLDPTQLPTSPKRKLTNAM